MPGDLSTVYPDIAVLGAVNSTDPALVKGAPPTVRGEEIASLGGQPFVVFQKSPTAFKGGHMVELYEEVRSRKVGKDSKVFLRALDVEVW